MTFHKTGGNMVDAGSVSPYKEDITIGDYIKRKEERYNNPFIMPDGSDISGLHSAVVKAVKPKLTFKEWAKSYTVSGHSLTDTYHHIGDLEWKLLEDCWKAAQENV